MPPPLDLSPGLASGPLSAHSGSCPHGPRGTHGPPFTPWTGRIAGSALGILKRRECRAGWTLIAVSGCTCRRVSTRACENLTVESYVSIPGIAVQAVCDTYRYNCNHNRIIIYGVVFNTKSWAMCSGAILHNLSLSAFSIQNIKTKIVIHVAIITVLLPARRAVMQGC